MGDVTKYISVLKEIEPHLIKLSENKNTILIITSDHGNDPNIKDGKHTREYVPLWTNTSLNLAKYTLLSDVSKLINSLV